MLCKCYWIVLYIVHFTAFCLGGPFFSGHGVHSAFSTNLLTDIDKTKHNYSQQQHKNLNKQTRKLLTYEQTEPKETKDWFMGL